MQDALVDRDAAADAEDQHGDDQAPEVELLAVAERMALVGRPLRQAHADEQEQPSPVSTSEWMPSESIAELPVAAAPANFITAMATLAAIAPKTASFESAIRGPRGDALAVEAGRARRDRRLGRRSAASVLPASPGLGNGGGGAFGSFAPAAALVQSALLAVGFGRAAARAAADPPRSAEGSARGVRHHRRAQLLRIAATRRAGVDTARDLRVLRRRRRQARRRLGGSAPAQTRRRRRAPPSARRDERQRVDSR